ncbi:MAG TPA: response regulator [Burkholderiaceae bacterium]|nr:response regulator [Burkholderiaceae bacterium]
MAVDIDRRAVGPARTPLSGWLVASGVLLIVSLVAALFVQVRQQSLLQQAVQGQDDYLVLNLMQFETEYLRLRERWRQAAADPASAREQLQLRYDIFVSRIGLLQTERAQRVLSDGSQYDTALRAIRDFVDRSDLYLGQNAQAPFSAAAMAALLADLDALDEPVHQMLLAGAHRVALQVSALGHLTATHNRVGMALTAFLSLLVGVFGTLALRRMRQLDDSRRALQAMASRLDDAREQAQRASQAKSEFLTQMSHAIRTPFHGVLGMLALLRETRLDARQQELLRTATDSADHLLGLLNDIVDLSKLEADTLALEVGDVDMADLLAEVERAMRRRAVAKALQFAVEVDPALPRPLRLDGARLRRVLSILLANAIRFTQRGGVTLACSAVAADGKPALQFVVSDTGAGMSADSVLRLFERSRPNPNGPRQTPGLGLEVAHRLVRLMQGDITVQSELGQGSSFRVTLPLPGEPAADDATSAAAAPAAAADTHHVLVAEDHTVNRLFLAALLERMGHSAHFVENGLEALQAAQEHRFDIVLMDVHMPVMDGIAATEAIRRLDAPVSKLPIVALTADAYADTRTRCLAAGMNEVLVKPLGMPELHALFERHFGAAARASAAA